MTELYHPSSSRGTIYRARFLLLSEGSLILIEAHAAKAKSAGDRFTIVPLKGSTHFDVIPPRTPFFQSILDATHSLLK